MKREILFRGKRVDNGEWVEGDLFTTKSCQNGIQKDHSLIGLIYSEWYEVDPETIGQFTGLVDKNGGKIFEGDVVRSQGQNATFIQVIEFHNTDKYCGRGWVAINKQKEYLDKTLNKKIEGINDGSYFSLPCNTEVIGNIHDTPELKGGQG